MNTNQALLMIGELYAKLRLTEDRCAALEAENKLLKIQGGNGELLPTPMEQMRITDFAPMAQEE